MCITYKITASENFSEVITSEQPKNTMVSTITAIATKDSDEMSFDKVILNHQDIHQDKRTSTTDNGEQEKEESDQVFISWDLSIEQGIQALTRAHRAEQTKRLSTRKTNQRAARRQRKLNQEGILYRQTMLKEFIHEQSIFMKPSSKMNRDGYVEIPENRVQQKEIDDGCHICLEAFINKDLNDITFCAGQCGKSFHRECIKQWRSVQIDKLIEEYQEDREITWGPKITCPNCRAAWLPGQTMRQQFIGSMLDARYKRVYLATAIPSPDQEEKFFVGENTSILYRPACDYYYCDEDALAVFCHVLEKTR